MNEYWAKHNVVATLGVGLLSIAITLLLFFVESREHEIGTQTIESSESSETSLPTVSISSIHVSEVTLDIPAVFEMAIQVGGASNLSARDIDLILDFGRAEIEVCDYMPKSAVTHVVDEDKSYHRLEIAELRQEEKFYIRCLISSPVFENVIIKGGNTRSTRSIDFEQYQANLQSGPFGFWQGLGVFFVLFFSAIFCLKVIGFMFPNL